MTRLTLLVTGIGVGGGVDILKCFRAAQDCDLRIVGTDIHDRVPARCLADAFYTTPRRDSPDFVTAVLDIAKREGADLVYPLPTGDNGVFSRRRERFEQSHLRLAAVDRRVFGLCQNKWRLYQEIAKLDRALCPRSIPVHSKEGLLNAARELGYPERPICLRRFIGSGAQGFLVISGGAVINVSNVIRTPVDLPDGLESLAKALEGNGRFPRVLLQEFLPGEEWDIDAVAREGELVAAVPRRNESMERGMAVTTIVEPNPELLRLSAEIVRHLRVTGAISLTFMSDVEGKPKLLEINPRLPMSVRCCVAAGVNIPHIAVCSALDQACNVGEPAWGTSYTRYVSGAAFGPNGEPLAL